MTTDTTTLEQAIQDQAEAQAAVDAALADGKPTTEPRARLKKATAELKKAKAAEDAKVQAAQEQIRIQAEALTAERVAEAQAAMQEILASIAKPAPPMLDPKWAESLILARTENTDAEAELAVVEERAAVFVARWDAMQVERQAIIERRTKGEEHDDDGERLALLDADIAGMEKLSANLNRDLKAIKIRAEAAKKALHIAELEWEREAFYVKANGLWDVALTLEPALVRAVNDLNIDRPYQASRKLWRPQTDGLRRALMPDKNSVF